MRKIILDNAYAAWQMAIEYCDVILAGRATLLNRKNFVSSLQNAVELFIKQIMLDSTDYRVAEIRNVSADGMPAREYYAAEDLNYYFENISNDVLNKFYSIDFRKIIDIHKQILGKHLGTIQTFKAQLSQLVRLRNMETHFYLRADQFLLEDEFVELYNFMIEFYNILQACDILPFKDGLSSEYKYLEFGRKKLSSFSYVNVAYNSQLVQKLKDVVGGLTFGDHPGKTMYSLASTIAACSEVDFSNQFKEIWEYLEVLDQYGLIEIMYSEHEIDREFSDGYYYECGHEIIEVEQEFAINIKGYDE